MAKKKVDFLDSIINDANEGAIKKAQEALLGLEKDQRVEYLLDIFENKPELLIFDNIQELFVLDAFDKKQRQRAFKECFRLAPTNQESISWLRRFLEEEQKRKIKNWWYRTPNFFGVFCLQIFSHCLSFDWISFILRKNDDIHIIIYINISNFCCMTFFL